jgi:hypothetical protein
MTMRNFHIEDQSVRIPATGPLRIPGRERHGHESLSFTGLAYSSTRYD